MADSDNGARRDAIDKMATSMRETAAKNGKQVTHTEARSRVVAALQRQDRKTKG